MRSREQSILSDVEFVEISNSNGRNEINFLSKLVSRYLLETDWVQKFGLSYKETMDLSYAEWNHMREQMDGVILAKRQATEEQLAAQSKT